MKVVEHFLDIVLERLMDSLHLNLLFRAQQVPQLMEVEVNFSCGKLCAFIVGELDASLIWLISIMLFIVFTYTVQLPV